MYNIDLFLKPRHSRSQARLREEEGEERKPLLKSQGSAGPAVSTLKGPCLGLQVITGQRLQERKRMSGTIPTVTQAEESQLLPYSLGEDPNGYGRKP